MINKTLKFCLAISLLTTAWAEERPLKNSQTDLDNLVVVAYKQARPVQQVVGDVTVISADSIAKTITQDMTAAVKYESNIHIEDGGTRFGSSGINIRGIGGNRVAIEVDNVPNAKAFNLGSYSFATADFPEIDLIQRIEILKGPASTLYGSDALGGIVAINTWDPDVLLARHAKKDGRWSKLNFGFDGKRHGRFVVLSSAWDFDNQSLLLSGTQRDGKGVVNENSSLAKDAANWDAQSAFGKWKINTNNGNNLTLNFLADHENQFTEINSFIGQGRFSNTTALSAEDESNNQKLSFNYEFMINQNIADEGKVVAYYANTEFQQNSYENRTSRQGEPLYQYRQFNFDSNRIGMELNFTKSWSTEKTSHQLIYGFELTQSYVQESRDANETNLLSGAFTGNVLGETFPLRDFPKTHVNEFGLYLHDEIILDNSNWTVVPAIRFDYYDLSPNRDRLFDNGSGAADVVPITASDFSPKLGLMYKVNEEINLYAQYVRGFRAPPYDDVNIGFNLALFNFQAIPNPDLKSETSNGLELGFRYHGNQHQFDINIFYNDYQDLIVSREQIGFDPQTQALIFQSRNIDEAAIYGAEIDYQWQISKQWSMGGQLAWTRGENKITDRPLNHISPPKASVNLQWQSENQKWDVGLFGIFSQAKKRLDDTDEDLFKTPGYSAFDLIAGYQLSQSSQLRIGVYNLTNKKYWSWQQVRNFENTDAIIEAMTQASRHFNLSYSMVW